MPVTPAAILALLLAPLAAASTADKHGQETFLLPIYTRIPIEGLHGSRWMATLTVGNANDEFVQFGPCHVPSDDPCPPVVFGIPADEILIDPRVGLFGTNLHGRLVYAARDLAPLLTMKLRLADVSRRDTDAGTEVPVIRSRDFSTTRLRLMNVPLNGEGRVSLRVFDVDDAGESAVVEIRIRTLDGALLHSEVRTFIASGYPLHEGLPFGPSYIDITLEPRDENVHVEIIPVSAGLRFWAYASITNNATQHVTLVTP